jgi:geranylgeranyl pyrophosphate synthase
VHDDVVDEADRRRGQYAVNTFFGNEASVLMGDYLVCCGLRMISDEPDPRLMRSICDVIVSMCEAEVLQITFRGDLDNTFENYLKVIRNKTARLFSFTAMAGGMLAGASQPVLESLADFGMNLGLAFQIVDDILDLTGDEQALGKPIAADLREGKFTYPILHAIGESCGEQRLYLASLLGDPSVLDEDGLDSVIEIVRGSGGFQAAYECASQYAHKASAVLLALPESPAREALFTVVSQVIERRF